MPEGSPLILLLVVNIMLSVFSVGLGATPGAALRFMRQPTAVANAMAAMFLAMPLLAVLLSVLLPLQPTGRTALLALALSPLPPLFAGKDAKLDEDHVIGIELKSAVASVMAVPLFAILIAGVFNVPLTFQPVRMVVVLLAKVAGPLFLGIAVNRWAPHVAQAARTPIRRIVSVMLGASALVLVVQSWVQIRDAATPAGLLAIALMIAIGLAIGHALGRSHRASDEHWPLRPSPAILALPWRWVPWRGRQRRMPCWAPCSSTS